MYQHFIMENSLKPKIRLVSLPHFVYGKLSKDKQDNGPSSV